MARESNRQLGANPQRAWKQLTAINQELGIQAIEREALLEKSTSRLLPWLKKDHDRKAEGCEGDEWIKGRLLM